MYNMYIVQCTSQEFASRGFVKVFLGFILYRALYLSIITWNVVVCLKEGYHLENLFKLMDLRIYFSY